MLFREINVVCADNLNGAFAPYFEYSFPSAENVSRLNF